MTALSSVDRTRLIKLCGMLGSDHVGERASAATRVTELLRKAGATWSDVLLPVQAARSRPAPTPRPARGRASEDVTAWGELQLCVRNVGQLSSWESSFVHSLITLPHWSKGQRTKLAEIVSQLRAKGVR